MVIEGVKEFEAVRDFLYARMRGVKEPVKTSAATQANTGDRVGLDGETARELALALRETASELREVRRLLERGNEETKEGGSDV